jgi:PAS domain-containing protein
MAEQDAEQQRLNALQAYRILHTGPEEEFESLARLASYICKAPIACISFVDGQTQWMKAAVGTDVQEVPWGLSFCLNTLNATGVNEMNDMSTHPGFSQHPFVAGDPQLRFYAGAPLITSDGFRIGTICVLDFQSRVLDDQQKDALVILAGEVISHLEVKRKNHLLAESLKVAQEFQGLFNNSNEVHCITDGDGRIEFINDSIRPLLGYDPAAVLHTNIWDYSLPGERDRVMPPVQEAMARGEVRFRIETQVRARR